MSAGPDQAPFKRAGANNEKNRLSLHVSAGLCHFTVSPGHEQHLSYEGSEKRIGGMAVCPKGLSKLLISYITDEDIVCAMGDREKRLLFCDDSPCRDEECYMGQASKGAVCPM